MADGLTKVEGQDALLVEYISTAGGEDLKNIVKLYGILLQDMLECAWGNIRENIMS